MIENTLTEIGNLIFVIGAATGAITSAVWLKRNMLSEHSKVFVVSFIFMTLAVAIRIGWWALGLAFAEPEATYAQWALDHKHIVTLPTAGLFLVGVIKFIGDIESYSFGKMLCLFLGICALATALTVLV